MKHNYISQGKNYISSKRASEISDYSSDYIGQLCRAGRLDCERVGHVWFVTEESLRSHMTDVWSQDALRSRASNLKKRFIKEQNQTGASAALNDSKKRISSKQAALLSGYAADYIGQLCRSGKLEAVMIGKTWFVVEESLKAHLDKIKAEEETRRIEETKKREEKSLAIQTRIANQAKIDSMNQLQKAANRAIVVAPIAVRLLSPFRNVFTRSALIIILFIALVCSGSAAIVSLVGDDTSAIRQSSTANVYDTAKAITDLISNSFKQFANILSGKHDLAVNTADQGLAVFPSAGSIADDNATKAAIKRSFSDQVNVVADKDNTSGVITPVFKKANGKDYMYVMVPVNPNQRPP